MISDFEPKIIAFVCNWCSYAGADGAGGQKLSYPANIKIIRVMCSGRIDPRFVMDAYRKGADGVMILGCRPGDCHYRSGNTKAMKRMMILKRLLDQFGVEQERFQIEWVAAGESEKFQKVTSLMVEAVKKVGPLKLKGYVDTEAL